MSYRCFGFRKSGTIKGMFPALVFEDLGTRWICALFWMFLLAYASGPCRLFGRGPIFRASSRFAGNKVVEDDGAEEASEEKRNPIAGFWTRMML